MKSQSDEHFLQELPFYSIICFAHVELKGHITLTPIPLLLFHVVKVLESDNHIVIDHMPWHKSTLGLMDNEGQKIFQPVHQDFRHEFKNNIT